MDKKFTFLKVRGPFLQKKRLEEIKNPSPNLPESPKSPCQNSHKNPTKQK